MPILTLPGKASAQADIEETGFDQVYHVDWAYTGPVQAGTADAPFKTLGQAFAEVAGHTTRRIRVLVTPGTYREGGLQLQDRDALLVIEPASTGKIEVSGSDTWTAWEEAGGLWEAAWPHKWGLAPVEAGMDLSEVGRRSEMVFVNGILYRQVITVEALTPGSFLVDEASETLRLLPLPGHDPTTATIEVAVRQNLLNLSRVSNFVLRGLVFRHSASGPMHTGAHQRAVFISGQGDGGAETVFGMEERIFNENFLMEDCLLEWNNSTGLTLANARNFTIRDTRFRHNGRSGMGTNRARHAVWEGLHFEANNWRSGLLGGAYGWDPAGVKLLRYDDLRILDSSFRGNFAAGLWIDYGNTRITARGIRSTHNWKNGVYYEANRGPFLLEDSLVRDNGFALFETLWDGGLLVAESVNTTVRRSVIANNNYYAVGTRNRDRLSTMYWTGETCDGKVENITFEDSLLAATRTEANMKNFPSNFGDNHFNGGVLVAHTHGTVSWFGEYTAPTYSGSGNIFSSPFTARLFTNVPSTGYGFNRITLPEWSTATNGQDADSAFDADWRQHAQGDAFLESDGLVVIETENTTSRDTVGDELPWQDGHGFHSGRIGHSGWGYIAPTAQAAPGYLHLAAGRANYRIHITTPGGYTLALRHWNADTADSPAIHLNGAEAASPIPLPSSNGRWTWRRVATFNLEPGLHLLTLERPPSGSAYDRLMLAATPTLLPPDGDTEAGPPESAQSMPVFKGPTPYEEWTAKYFSSEELADPALEATLWGPEADPDRDGLPNLLEYAFVGDPHVAHSATLPAIHIIELNGQSYPGLRVTKNPVATDLVYDIETSADMEHGSWTSDESQRILTEDTHDSISARSALPLSAEDPRRFLRAAVFLLQ